LAKVDRDSETSIEDLDLPKSVH